MADSSSSSDEADSWVMLDSDNPADSSDDDRRVLVLSSSCPTPDCSDHDSEDDDEEMVGDDGEDVYDLEDAEDNERTPRPPPPKPLSGVFYHNLYSRAAYAPFDALRLRAGGKQLVPDPSFSAFPEAVAVLASTRGLVCLRGATTGCYYIANPATFTRVRLPPQACAHDANGDPAVVITFEEPDPSASEEEEDDDMEHYHVVVAFHICGGAFAFECFSSRTWAWRVGHEIAIAEDVVHKSGVGAIGRAFWRTPVGGILCYHPEAVWADVIPTPKEMDRRSAAAWELGEMDGNLCIIYIDEKVTEVDVFCLNLDHRAVEDRWAWAGQFDCSKLSNRESIELRRSQGGAEVVIWDPLDERVLALDLEGRITRLINFSGEKYLADFIPYVSSNAEITRDLLRAAGAEALQLAAPYPYAQVH